MDSFGSDFSSGSGTGKMDTGAIMEQVKVQIAVANAQELLQVGVPLSLAATNNLAKRSIGQHLHKSHFNPASHIILVLAHE